MENPLLTNQDYRLSFHGKGGELFGIIIVNWLFTVFTLGLYYPWAKARMLQYIYGSVSMNDDRFEFHGTGNEMFRGFIKTILVFGLIIVGFVLLNYNGYPLWALLVLYVGFLAFVPLAMHGSYRYRMSRTSWRGIRGGYRGNRTELYKKYFTWLFFTIVSFGIYSFWLAVNLRNYLLSNVRVGNMSLRSRADGGDYFALNLKGYFLTIITFGIYSFWWYKELFNFYVNHLSLHKDDQRIRFYSTATGGGFFGLMIVNLFIIIFTFGFGYAWAVTRTMDYVVSHIRLKGNIDLDTICQTEDDYRDAMGDDMNDFLNIDFIV